MTGRLPKFTSAAEIVRRRDGNPRGGLTAAGREFWAALFDRDKLPGPFCDEADAIVQLLLAEGRIERSVAAMDDSTAEAVGDRIVRFAEELRQAGLL
ncbi:MAG: hypothetical protein WD069_12065 [Planctomycetales bacterium]